MKPEILNSGASAGASSRVFTWDLTGEPDTSVSTNGAIAGLSWACRAVNMTWGTLEFINGTGLDIEATSGSGYLSNTVDRAPSLELDWSTIDPTAETGDLYMITVTTAAPSWPAGAYYWAGVEVRNSTRTTYDWSTYWSKALSVQDKKVRNYKTNTATSDTDFGSLGTRLDHFFVQGNPQDVDLLRLFMARSGGTTQKLRVLQITVDKL